MSDDTAFPTWFKARRKALDLTQAELADRAACSPITIRKIEAGDLRPSRELADLLAAALEVTEADRPAFIRFARSQTALAAPATTAQTLPDAAVPVTNLPAPGVLIGRAREVAGLQDLFAARAVSLVTLTGPGGAGKTTLAVAVATALADRFPDGRFFVDLAPLVAADLVATAVAHTLGIVEAPGVPVLDLLLQLLRPRTVLLLLDNFEHVLAAAPLVAQLLDACPHLKVLATSREPLHVRGEQEYPVAPLATPAVDADIALTDLAATPAVALFVARARGPAPVCAHAGKSARRGRTVPAARRAAIGARIGRRASKSWRRRKSLPCSSATPTNTALTSTAPCSTCSPAARATCLTASAPCATPSPGATLCWSRPNSRWCAPSPSLPAAARLRPPRPSAPRSCPPAARAPAILDTLASLVEKNLLLMHEQVATRYTMLQTIREFALAELTASGAETVVRTAHAHYLVTLAASYQHRLSLLAELDGELDNIRTALAWLVGCVEANPPAPSMVANGRCTLELLALQLAGALRPFWLRRNHDREGRRWCERLLTAQRRAPPDDAVYLAALAQVEGAAGDMAWLQTDHGAAVAHHTSCLELSRRCGDRAGAAFALNNLGVQATDMADFAAGRALLEEALDLARQVDSASVAVAALSNLTLLYLNQGDLALALGYGEEALRVAVKLDDDYQLAIVLLNVGDILRLQGEDDRALAMLEQCILLAQRSGILMVWAVALPVIAKIKVRRGQYVAAAADLHRALTLAQQLHRPNVVAESLEVLAALAVEIGAPLAGARFCGAAEQVRATHGHPRATADEPVYTHYLARLRDDLPPAVLASQWAAGRAYTLEDAGAQAIAYAAAVAAEIDGASPDYLRTVAPAVLHG